MLIPAMRSLLFAGLLIATFLNARAADFANEASAVRFALTNNRDLRAARLTVSAAEARVRGAGRLSHPEIEATVAGGQDFQGRVEIGLTQRFPLTARLRLEKEISRLEIDAAQAEVAEREREIVAKVREAFLHSARAREARLLRSRQAELGATFTKSLQSRVTEGFDSPLDAAEAALEAVRLQAQVAELRAEEESATGKLAALLGMPGNETLTVKDIPALPNSPPAAGSPTNRPDIRLAEIAIEAAEKDLGLARAMRWEDIGVGVFVEGERFRDEPEGIEPEGLVGLRLSVPLPVWNNGEAAVEERKAIAQRRIELLQAIRLTAAHEAASAWRQMKARFEAARQMQNEALPAARELLADIQAAHERGETDAQRLFRIRERLIAIETETLESRAQFHLARAAWLHATGASTP